jgi:7-keto-8-aminopelargonate synthetase-like enzyme
MENSDTKLNKFANIKKAINIGNPFWDETEAAGLSNLTTAFVDSGRLVDDAGNQFINMSSFSYLGLDAHPALVEGAIAALQRSRTLNSSIARVRMQLPVLREAEAAMSSLYDVDAFTTVSCAAAAAAVLPLIAAGLFTDNVAPIMAFDKHAHFCLNLIKPICADETVVETVPHNDLNYLEDLCKKHQNVAYVADGVYSTGGRAPVRELLELQQRYGLFLFFDEAHGLSAYGKHGRGFVLEEMGEINSRTIIVSSLNKGFGASGGAIFFGPGQHRSIVNRYGGPLSWSQGMNTAGLGAILASVELHRSAQIDLLQTQLRKNVDYFDSLIPTEHGGDGLAIRLVPMLDEKNAVKHAKDILKQGYYTRRYSSLSFREARLVCG